jgi:hypothetical protein
MRKMILTVLGSALIAASLTQAAAAAGHHKVRKVACACAPAPSGAFRNANAYYVPYYPWPPSSWLSSYGDEALSPPAGH